MTLMNHFDNMPRNYRKAVLAGAYGQYLQGVDISPETIAKAQERYQRT